MQKKILLSMILILCTSEAQILSAQDLKNTKAPQKKKQKSTIKKKYMKKKPNKKQSINNNIELRETFDINHNQSDDVHGHFENH